MRALFLFLYRGIRWSSIGTKFDAFDPSEAARPVLKTQLGIHLREQSEKVTYGMAQCDMWDCLVTRLGRHIRDRNLEGCSEEMDNWP